MKHKQYENATTLKTAFTEELKNAFPEITDFEIEEAIYYLCSFWHSGQGSDMYSIMSTSEFKPGFFQYIPEDETHYKHLEKVFCDH